jgi:hypothetical protein
VTRVRSAAATACAGVLAAGIASAGGPLFVRTNGQTFTWSTASAVQYRTDHGPLSGTVDEPTARSRVQSMFAVWQNVASASISYSRAGFISNAPGFSDGDVSTFNEYNAVFGDCADGNQSPIIYDPTAAIFIALGDDETSVIGFAGACDLNSSQGRIVSAHAVMNGLFQDGTDNPVEDLTPAEFDTAFIHEFGHFSGLDHSQVNVECASVFSCGADDLDGLPTMFPFIVDAQQGSLSIDDVAWISKLYPEGGGGGFSATHGTISGRVFFSDGETQAQSVNVVARRADTGSNEDRRFAVSSVSGYRFHGCRPNPITNPTPEEGCSGTGSDDPDEIGFYEIPVPAGTYTIEVESIHPQFVAGSTVGPSSRPVPMPGEAPTPLGPITISAGQTSSGNDFVLIGTPPRFDQFEGPEP